MILSCYQCLSLGIYRVFPSADLMTWADHRPYFSINDAPWADAPPYAPDCR